MSWLFGKKKTKDSSPDSSEEASPSTSQADDYIFIEKDVNSSAAALEHDHTILPKSFGLYPSLGPHNNNVNVSRMSASLPQLDALCDPQTYLNNMKFELNKKFENDFEIDRLQADEILSFILRIKIDDFDYDFSLENSVVNEMTTSAQ